MPRRIRMESDRKHAENAQRASEKQLRKLRTELQAEWCSGRLTPTDTLSVIRTAKQWQLKLKQRRERRREQARQHGQREQQAA